MRSFLKVLLVFCLFLGICFSKHSCLHGKVSQSFQPTPLKSDGTEDHHRRMQAATTQPIRIAFDDSNLKLVSEAQRKFIMENLVPVGKEFFEKRLKILSFGKNVIMDRNVCYEVSFLNKFLPQVYINNSYLSKANIPLDHLTTGVDADLVIYLSDSYEPLQSYLAWATSCILSKYNSRPVAGQVNFNIAYLSTAIESFQDQMDTFLHEVKLKIEKIL